MLSPVCSGDIQRGSTLVDMHLSNQSVGLCYEPGRPLPDAG
jgi:hypothetical protein